MALHRLLFPWPPLEQSLTSMWTTNQQVWHRLAPTHAPRYCNIFLNAISCLISPIARRLVQQRGSRCSSSSSRKSANRGAVGFCTLPCSQRQRKGHQGLSNIITDNLSLLISISSMRLSRSRTRRSRACHFLHPPRYCATHPLKYILRLMPSIERLLD